MNYGEVLNLLVILFITYSLLVALVIYVILDFLYRWKRIGTGKTIYRILISLLSGPAFVLLYYYLVYSS